ncbi:MAG TPA: NAD(P)-dependent oxidoreductase [Bacteroidales bacterium]|nr:NAD(P)-dependent oxidoreductase [Bacteroidales bacterium]
MEKKLKVGILRETKTPPDRRVPLTPSQIVALQELYPFVEFFVQPSDIRCYNDEEYEYLMIPLREDLSHCDILMGVKEVDKRLFIEGKTYLFFAHVAKKQEYNRGMLQEILHKRVRLIDYEYLTTDKGQRVVAFGRWAGIVGAYNALRARGIKTNRFKLKPAYQCRDLDEMWAGLRMIQLKPGLKILVTGEGRVASGALETLSVCSNLLKVTPEDFLSKEYDVPVFCQIGPQHYVRHTDGRPFDFNNFLYHPEDYVSEFKKFTRVTDMYIAAHFWDPRSPVFFTREDVSFPEFRISVIADISCDIAGPVPTTLRATSIADPFYSYNRFTHTEEEAFNSHDSITVTSIDNLPGELPRDASSDYGRQLMANVLHDLFNDNPSPMILRATITDDGSLTPQYSYLADFVKGEMP